MSPEEIAEDRGLTVNTIHSHFVKLFQEGMPINLKQFVSDKELAAVKQAQSELGTPAPLKSYYEYFNEQMDYAVIKIALVLLEKEEV
ncbi:helix-turn-helix domain-containing protein [Ochrovirga pacifica]|uniref:helix-turn-helix domain-containing protein n=1 Tax=Ochrovirga pacifica TaxID=1042376 RepID=UPI000313C350|nr:helix-turn-helix domain-containing protein [Ochrovirga pacifica]